MGLAQSARMQVSQNLSSSANFNSACDYAYSHCLSDSCNPHGSKGVAPSVFPIAAIHLHCFLTSLQPHPLICRWLPFRPTLDQVDDALRSITGLDKPVAHIELAIGPTQFREWAVLVFTDAIVGNARKELRTKVAIGAAGIAGIGAVAWIGVPGIPVVGTLIGAYARRRYFN